MMGKATTIILFVIYASLESQNTLHFKRNTECLSKEPSDF